jgi:hypothetical protein
VSWRPARHGAVLLAGAVIPMAAQAISAIVQVTEATPPQQFGLTPAQASQLGLTISNGLTPVFWVYCALGLVLAVSCLWMLFTPEAPQASQAPQVPLAAQAAQAPQAADPAPGAPAAPQGESYGWTPAAYAWHAATPEPATPEQPADQAENEKPG